MCITVQQLTYVHADRYVLFKEIHFVVNKGQKVALVGANGSGKSTLLQLLAGQLQPSSGNFVCPDDLYYVPQHFGQYNDWTIAQALKIEQKQQALYAILNGDTSSAHLATLNDDWNLEERAQTALADWGLGHLALSQSLHMLSGGEKTRVFLAGMELHDPSLLLLDEPTNHLDWRGRERLYSLIEKSHTTCMVVSHDRALLNLLPVTYELTRNGITRYGGNYEFYKEQKERMRQIAQLKLDEKEKALRLERKIAHEAAERKQKQNVRGEKANATKGIPRIALKGLKDQAERSSSKLKDIHEEKSVKLAEELSVIRKSLLTAAVLKTDFKSSDLHVGKRLITAREINFSYHTIPMWKQPLDFQLESGDRLAIDGENGSGKTTLLKLITGELLPTEGQLLRADFTFVYLNQEYSIICNELDVLQQAELFNTGHLSDHELKTILHRFLFSSDTWSQHCVKLSGGEKMRLSFCCLMISNSTPDLFVLDEPTNNLDIQSIEIITSAIRDYRGTLLVVSHDRYFMNEVGVRGSLKLTKNLPM